MSDTYNPIALVDGVEVPTPSTYKFNVMDISASTAGRSEDTLMHKEKLGQCVKIELEWQNISTAKVSQILQAFDPEYITVKYLDAKLGSFQTSVFYVGDRSAPMYNARLGVWSNVSFNIIERSGL